MSTDSPTDPSNDAFAARARATLDAGDVQLDGVALARLAAARRAAVAAMDMPRQSEVGRWLPAGAAACMLVAVGMFAWSVRLPTLPVYDDEHAAAAAQDLDLLDEIEFVAWMVEQDGDDAA